MAIAGNLQTMSIEDLLQWVSFAQKSGTLTITSGDTEKTIVFDRGRIVSTASNDPREYLGQFLISYGYIGEAELKKAMEVQLESGILLGRILVTIGAITETELVRLMRRKAEESVFDVFLWPRGDFRFVEGEVPSLRMVPLQLDVHGVIMEGVRRVDEWKRIQQQLPDDAAVVKLDRSIDPASLSSVEAVIVQAIDGRRSVAEIVLETRSSPFFVSKTLLDLASRGFVSIAAAGTEAGERLQAPAGGEIPALIRQGQAALRQGDFRGALQLLQRAQGADPESALAATALRGAEQAIAGALKSRGVEAHRIPVLVRTYEEVRDMEFTANEGFLLSRVNGEWDIGSIVKVSPMRESDALVIFDSLRERGVIELR